MALSSKWLRTLLFAFVVLVALIGCKPDSPLRTTEPQSGAPASPLQVPSQSISILSTPTMPPDDFPPTMAPSPTQPPVPTPLPTPVVTPIPVAKPPFIPEVVGKAEQPFWVYYWQGNEVWRVDDQGKDRQLVIDTYKTLGKYLTDIPEPYRNTDCCHWLGQRVAVSPDGHKVALVVIDRLNGRMSDHFNFSIYVLDFKTNDLRFISEGTWPVWSPDSNRLAFFKGDALWVGDVASGQTKKYAEGDPEKSERTIWGMSWSPDSQQLLYTLAGSMGSFPEYWLGKVDDDSTKRQLLPPTMYGRFDWSPDGQRLFYISSEGGSDNLWTYSLTDGTKTQLTHYMTVGGWLWSPDGKWLALNAEYLYEKDNPSHDIWLLSADGSQLLRITSAQPRDTHDAGNIGGYWSPDGTRLLFTRDGIGLAILSLQTGVVAPLGVDLPDESRYNFAVGGNK